MKKSLLLTTIDMIAKMPWNTTNPMDSTKGRMPEKQIARRSPDHGGIVGYEVSDAMIARIKNDYTYHAPRIGQTERYTQINGLAAELATTMCTCCPESRELSSALSQLELARMLANAAIAREPE